MTLSFILTWLAVMLPLISSPGPANIVFAASGANFGVKNSIPLMLGVEVVFFSKSILIWFGLGTLLENNSSSLLYLQLLGAAYLFYLGYGFIKPALKNEIKQIKKLGFIDGVILQFFNVKGWILLLLMFSLFSSNVQLVGENATIVTLILILSVLSMSVHLLWISSSAFLVKKFFKKQNQKLQGLLFGGSLIGVGIWFIVDSRLFTN